MRVITWLVQIAVIICICEGGRVECRTGYKPCATDDRCCCKKSIAFCGNHGKQLTYIPQLPDGITKLTFTNNSLTNIDNSSFANISNLNLTILYILTCNVSNVSVDAFATLRVLRVLGLDHNEHINQTQLSRALGSIQKTAQITLSLSSIGLTEIKTDLFRHLTDANLTNLNLDANKLTFFDFKTVYELRSLETLSITDNHIRAIDIDNGHRKLKYILLSGNEFARYVPAFCSEKQKQNLFPSLSLLDLRKNFISELNNQSWTCLNTLKTLKLMGNVIRTVQTNTFSGLTNLFLLQFSWMAGVIKTIEPHAFNNSHLKNLSLEGNFIVFKKQDTAGIFLGSDNLEKLIISRNKLDKLSDNELGLMFSPLINLKTLIAVNCKIKIFPVSLIRSLTNLSKLILDRNRIESLGDILTYVGNLSTLSLQSNYILTLQKVNLPQTMRSNLINLNLAGNRFECTCDLLWFKSTVTDGGMLGNFNLTSWPNNYTCATPASRANTRLLDYKPTQMSCKNILLISVLCVSSFAVLVTVTASLTYKFRWYIQLWWYKLNINEREPERQPLLGAQTGQFRGYVIYDSNDAPFVHHDFRVLVEQDMLYKLKIWERDASIGGSQLKEMVDSIYASETVIAVISKSSLENDWVRFQINVALDRQVELRRDFLILVLLEDLVYKVMPNYWCVMLTRTPTARWCTDVNGIKRKVFEQQLHQHFNTL